MTIAGRWPSTAIANGHVGLTARHLCSTTLTILAVLTTCSGPVHAQTDLALYGSLRLATQHADDASRPLPDGSLPRNRPRDDHSGFRNYQSRIGAKLTTAHPWPGGRTAAFVHGELGSVHNRLSLRTRLLFAGIRSEYGTLSYGKQWTAFYNAVGRFMDVALNRSGFGYLGSERTEHGETLQYSTVWRLFHFQADAIRDDRVGSGFNRYQLGVDYQGAVWHLGAAIDLKEGDGNALISMNLHPKSGDPPCDQSGVDCLGAVIGWRYYEWTVDVGVNRAESNIDHVNGGAITVQWKPNEFNYYAELSSVRGAGYSSKTAALGVTYTWNSYVSGFFEASASGIEGRHSNMEHVIGLGIKLELERFF